MPTYAKILQLYLQRRMSMGRMFILWLVGVPLSLIIILKVLGVI